MSEIGVGHGALLPGGTTAVLLLHEFLTRLYGIVIYANYILLRRTVAETDLYGPAVRVCGSSVDARRLVTTYHVVDTPGIYYALYVMVERMLREGMA